jgi:predicted HTH transcriptional regulator
LHDRDRGNLRKAISGFANSEGGVVVWGIDCSKDAKVGDTATARVPITSPRRFVSWIEGAVSGCTVPPATEVRSVAVTIDSSTGIVATLIPKSPRAPHQVAGEGKYMIRAGSDFVPAPHGVVAGLFGHPHILWYIQISLLVQRYSRAAKCWPVPPLY